MKSVLISIKPKWCELIASGKKTVEVRKTKPKIDTPFKGYIYCTYGEGLIEANDEVLPNHLIGVKVSKNKIWGNCCNGKVIGEFICDEIINTIDIGCNDFYTKSCMSLGEWLEYTDNHKGEMWCWHISDLVIYDKPKELSEFYTRCYSGCDNCQYQSWDYALGGGKDLICTVSNKKPIKRPPQSWCYVELLKGGAE